jgi:hypothetical protein
MLASAVSSTALGAMAAVEGFKFEQTLTGFKWLGNIAKARQAQGFKVLFAFEEAIGFMFPDVGMVSGCCRVLRGRESWSCISDWMVAGVLTSNKLDFVSTNSSSMRGLMCVCLPL